MNKNFNVGDIVRSLAGRDADRYYVIIAKEDDFAYICNGKLHKLDKPKKKKLKHLTNTGCTYEQLMGMQPDRALLTNPKLKKAIYKFKNIQL